MLNKNNKKKSIVKKNINGIDKNKIKEIQKNNKPHHGDKNVSNSKGYIIEAKNVFKSFTNGYVINDVLTDINMSIKEGEFVVILGRSGSGKTTLINILSGLTRASNGETIVANTNLINLTNNELTLFRRKNISFIFQEYGLLNTLSVYENILVGYNLNKKNNDKSIIDKTIDMMGLSLFKKKYPSELSGGQQQRVAIARAIVKNPKIIFGDEPTGAVDSKMSKIILSLLKEINKKNNTTIVIITHDRNIAKIADTVYEIIDGKIKSKIINSNPINIDEL